MYFIFLGLSSLHTVFTREHNRLASKIKAYAKHKTDADVMFEARRYIVASIQSIVYRHVHVLSHGV